MAKVSLNFWQGGAHFEPKVYPDDLANYEDQENGVLAKHNMTAAQASQGPQPAALKRDLFELQAKFIAEVLGRDHAGPAATLKLTVAQIREAWDKIFVLGTFPDKEEARPLGKGGATSPSSS